jgi:hypothetical protein
LNRAQLFYLHVWGLSSIAKFARLKAE